MSEGKSKLEGAYTLLSPAEAKAERALLKAERFEGDIVNLKNAVENVSSVIDFWEHSLKKEDDNEFKWNLMDNYPIDGSFCIFLDSDLKLSYKPFKSRDGFDNHCLSHWGVKYIGWIYFPSPILIELKKNADKDADLARKKYSEKVLEADRLKNLLKVRNKQIKELRSKK